MRRNQSSVLEPKFPRVKLQSSSRTCSYLLWAAYWAPKNSVTFYETFLEKKEYDKIYCVCPNEWRASIFFEFSLEMATHDNLKRVWANFLCSFHPETVDCPATYQKGSEFDIALVSLITTTMTWSGGLLNCFNLSLLSLSWLNVRTAERGEHLSGCYQNSDIDTGENIRIFSGHSLGEPPPVSLPLVLRMLPWGDSDISLRKTLSSTQGNFQSP